MNGMEKQMSIFDQDTWCGKTSPEHSAQTKAKISESSLKKSQRSATKIPLFLCLTKENGQTADASWETDGVSLGGFSMHSFGESPNAKNQGHNIVSETATGKNRYGEKIRYSVYRLIEEKEGD